MKQPEKYFCDMRGTEITSTSGFINQRIPVVTEFEVKPVMQEIVTRFNKLPF